MSPRTILCAAMLAASGGLGVAYLGADLPSSEIIDAVGKTKAAVLVLGLKGAVSVKEPMRELHRIAEKLPLPVELWVGGVRSADLVAADQNYTRRAPAGSRGA